MDGQGLSDPAAVASVLKVACAFAAGLRRSQLHPAQLSRAFNCALSLSV